MLRKSIEDYRYLRRQVDCEIANLEAVHRGHLMCRVGCCGCCVNLTVFAVELYSIAGQLAESGVGKIDFNPSAVCGWLENGMCRIYPVRPIICRTHGLPVAISKEDGSAEREVSFCPLNFTQIDPETFPFGPGNSLDLVELNERLSRINADFIEGFRRQDLDIPVRIELTRLSELLAQMKG